ncbi:DUF3828 domain-containing protein [Haliscomenobacter sp.]|uniref:DUF3828 domain-containing protein n=1 Tax=Haliscomenobacter sp. TaxID=2717303 RepID=UPI003BA950EA
MKYLLLFSLAVFSFTACQNSANKTAETTEELTDSDGPEGDTELVPITDAIHNFYKWYGDSINSLQKIEYINFGGKHLTLNKAKLDTYFDQFLKTGFISKEYVDAEKAYLKNLETTVWAKETYEDGPVPGWDYDRFFCAQDWDIKFWTTAPVDPVGLGNNRVSATLSGDEGGSERTQNFELKKENGKWLITKIACEN